MTIGEKLAKAIEPHALKFDTDPNSVFPRSAVCHEPALPECPGRVNFDIDDFVFIMDSDLIDEGVISLLPAHRECMELVWGEKHVIPRRTLDSINYRELTKVDRITATGSTR